MASIASIAKKRADATTRLTDSMRVISEALGIPEATLPTRAQDMTLLHAQHLEALADWSEAVEKAIGQPAEVEETETRVVDASPDYANMTDDELRSFATEKGWFITTAGKEATRQQLIDMIGQTPTVVDAVDYSQMNKAEVLAIAEGRGMVIKANTSKTEAVDWLLASDGVTEDEQAAMDSDETTES